MPYKVNGKGEIHGRIVYQPVTGHVLRKYYSAGEGDLLTLVVAKNFGNNTKISSLSGGISRVFPFYERDALVTEQVKSLRVELRVAAGAFKRILEGVGRYNVEAASDSTCASSVRLSTRELDAECIARQAVDTMAALAAENSALLVDRGRLERDFCDVEVASSRTLTHFPAFALAQ